MSRVLSRRSPLGERLRRVLLAVLAVVLGAGAVTLSTGVAAAAPNPTITSSPTNATTATPLEWAFTNASPASCQLTEGAVTVSALANCTSPADYDVSARPGGNFTFTVYAAAAASVVVGTTPSASSTVPVAPVAPTITASPVSPFNDPTPTWSFTLPTGATATCAVTSPASAVIQTVANCKSPFTAANLNASSANGANGQYTLTVTPTAGGVAGAAATSTYDYDTVKPAAPTVTADATTGFSLHPTFTVTGIVAGATLTCTVTRPAGGPAVVVASCGAASSLDLTGGIDGTYRLHVKQTVAGNVSAAGTASYLLDTHTPATPTVTAPASPGTSASPKFTISGIEAKGTPVCTVTGPSTVPTPTCAATTTLNLSGAANGTYTLSVVVRDPAGMSSAPASATYQYEAVPPTAPVVTAPSSPNNSLAPSFGVSDTDPVGLTYTCTVTGPSTVTTSACGPVATIDLTGAADGTYQLSVVAKDGVGHVSPVGTASYTLDTTPPPAPVVTAPASPSQNTEPVFGITESESGATLGCTVTGPTPVSVPPADCVSGVVLDLSGANRDGVYTLSVTATDAAGNVSSAGSASYTLDTTPPPPPTITAPVSPSKDLSPTFGVSDSEVGTTLSCVFTDPASTVLFSGSCSGSVTFDTSGDPTDGMYRLVVTAADAAGNTSSKTVKWTRDTVPPPTPNVAAPLSPSNQIAPAFDITDTEAGVAFTCVLTGPGAVTVFSGGCPAAGTFDLTGFGDGSYTLSVTASDAAGNVSGARTASYTLDTTPPPRPTVTLSAPLLSLGNVTAPTFDVTDTEAGVTYDCSVSGPTAVPQSAISCGTTTSVDLSGMMRDGTYTLSVRAVDEAGNASAPGTATYTLDTTPPPAPTVVAPPSPSQDLTPTFTISDSESDARLDCLLTGPGATIAFAGQCPANGTFDLAGFGDGSYVLAVTATDPAGNTSIGTGSATYVVDTTPPPAPTVTLWDPAASPGNLTVPQFTVTDAEPGVTFTCTVDGPTPVASVDVACGALTSVDLSGAGRDGTYTVSITATDAAGNTSSAGTATYTLDTTPPPAPTVTLSTPPSSPGSAVSPQFSVTDPETGVSFVCSVSGVTPVPASAIDCGATTTVDLSGSGRDGSYTLTVHAVDEAGNASMDSTATYVLDTSPPPVPTVTLSVPASSPGNVTAPSFTVSDAEPGVAFSCTVTGATPVPASAIDCGATTAVDLSGTGRDGTYTLSVEAVDAAGNASVASTATYTLDTTPPPVPAVALSNPASSPSSVTEPSFAVSDTEPGVTLSCSVNGPTTVPSAAISCGPTTTVDLSGAGRDGSYTLSVTATDAAGNTSAAGTATYVLDTTPPPAPAVALTVPAASPGQSTSPQFSVTDTESGVSFLCSVTGPTTVPSSAVTCGATTTVDLSGPGRDGTYTLSVTAVDAAGNDSPPATATYTLDTTAPPAPVVTVPGPSTKTPTFGISDGDPAAVLTCLLTSPRGRTVFPTTASTTCPAGGSFDTSAFADGTYTLVVTATDAAGNATSTTVTWLRDTTPPVVPVVTLSVPSSSPGNVTSPQFAVSEPEAGVTYGCAVTGPTTVPNGAITCGPTTTVNLSGSGRDGTYTLAVTATDAAGNTSAAGTATYTLDTTPPPAPTVALSAPPSSPGNLTSPQFTVADTEAGVTLTCAVSGPTAVPGSAVTCGPTTTLNLSGTGRDGTYTLSVTATDAAGNTSTTAGTASYQLDTTAPPTPVVTLASPASSPGNLTSPQFSVVDAEAGVALSCTVTGVTPVPSTSVTCGPTTTVNLSGTGRDGAYTLSVTATDAAGNVSSAATSLYTLDTTAPRPPLVGLASAGRSNSRTPLWTWQFGIGDVNTQLDVATCTVVGPRGWTSTTRNCPHHFSTTLGGGDGTYTLTVTLTDEAGNTASAVGPLYILDSTAPPGPTVEMLHPESGYGLDRHPVWSVKGPPGATLMCTLHEGGDNGPVISAEAVCPRPATYSLVGLPDGMFTLEVVAVDTAGNISYPAFASYVLVPSAPTVRPPTSESATAVWTVLGNPHNSYVCTLLRDGHVVSRARGCGSHPTYDMSRLPAGTYTLSVVQVGADGARSSAGVASWFWDGSGSSPPPPPPPPAPGTHHHHHHPTTVTPSGGNPLTKLPGLVRRQIQKLGHVLGKFLPIPSPGHPNRVATDVVTGVQAVVHAVGSAGGGTGFPLLLLGLVLAFLLVQNRIDRRDPKLALASITADDTVEFQPPPSRRDGP